MDNSLALIAVAVVLAACCGLPAFQPQANTSQPAPAAQPNYTPPAAAPAPPAFPLQPPAPPAAPGCPVGEIRSLLSEFNASRAAAYANCSVITRTDTFPCHDTPSCQRACYASWLCRQQAWNLDITFIEAIRDWRGNESMLGRGMEEAEAGIASGNGQAALEGIAMAREAAAAIQSNPLFGRYAFCPPMSFGWSALEAAESKVRTCWQDNL
ncbi:MAG: hypothetical protein QXG98_05255 [Candidatus Micrarchaeia archaeon]